MAVSIFSLCTQAGPIVKNGNFASYTIGGGNVDGGTITDWTLAPTTGPLGADVVAITGANVGDTYDSLEGNPSAGDGSNTNFFALDGSCCNSKDSSNPILGTLSQMLTLTGGQTYVLSFDYAAAQLNSENLPNPTPATCEQWVVTIGGSVPGPSSLTEPTCPGSMNVGGTTKNAYMVTGYLDEWSTPLLSIAGCDANLPACPQDFSGWYTEAVEFTVPGSGPTPELLSFFAEGSPIGGPPMDLLSNVSVVPAPEPENCALVGAILLGAFAFRRRVKKQG